MTTPTPPTNSTAHTDVDHAPTHQHIGNARVSTLEQTLDRQQNALSQAGCVRVFTDTISGAKAERVGLSAVIAYLRPGDTLVVRRLDRLGRSLQHLIETITALDTRGVGFQSLTEHIDTTTSSGKLIFHLFGALAEFERDLVRERTQAGLAAARARGRHGGRPARLASDKTVATARAMHADKANSIADICHTLHISRATLYRYLKPGTKDGDQAERYI